jgi:hypothetical protein
MSKNPGRLVRHFKSGKRGRTFNSKKMVNGKVPVYLETDKDFIFSDKAILCRFESIKVIGYID